MTALRQEPLLPRPLSNAEETDRLNCLHELGIIGTGDDEAIDNLVESVAAFFEVPMALVTLTGKDHQWFKARYGIDDEGTDRSASFCQFTICQSGVFRVCDARHHPEFKSYPVVVGPPHIRFYAGVPIRVRGGHAIGALCILDRRANSVPASQLDWLNHFASVLTQIIELNYAAEEERIIRQFASAEAPGRILSL